MERDSLKGNLIEKQTFLSKIRIRCNMLNELKEKYSNTFICL
jgi:hypothetical protein